MRWFKAVGLGVLVMVVLASFLSFLGRRSDAALLRTDPEAILADPRLRRFALDEGGAVFGKHCAGCHGRDAKGDPSIGAPDLTDRDRLHGDGRVAEIESVVRHGIRAKDPRGLRGVDMPGFAKLRPYASEPLPPLSPTEIEELTQFLLSGPSRKQRGSLAANGAALFAGPAGCWDCHGGDAAGDTAIGAPDLTDRVWLYGHGSHDDIFRSIAYGRAGYSPAFKRLLTPIEMRSVAVYVAALADDAGKPQGERP